jgi:nitrous oxidase accessory protein NosD
MVQPRLKVLLATLVAAMVIASLLLAAVYFWDNDEPSSIEETVWIQGDAELASSEYVTSGDGTEDNPYRIEGIAFAVSDDPQSLDSYGLRISRIEAHLVITELTFEPNPSSSDSTYDQHVRYGIGFWGVRNVTVILCEFESLNCGVRVSDTSEVNITTNEFRGCAAGVLMGEALDDSMPYASVTLWENQFRECGYAVEMLRWWNTEVLCNLFRDCDVGVYGLDTYGSIIRGNEAYGSRLASVHLTGGGIASIIGNYFREELTVSVKLDSVSHVTVGDNTVDTSGCGVLITDSHNVSVTENDIERSWYSNYPSVRMGVYILLSTSVNITWNSVSGMAVGIEIITNSDFPSSVNIHHNWFTSNQVSAIDTGGAGNSWDDGVSEGNYWDDYEGPDDDQDGIGDTPYLIDSDSLDRYPLMSHP